MDGLPDRRRPPVRSSAAGRAARRDLPARRRGALTGSTSPRPSVRDREPCATVASRPAVGRPRAVRADDSPRTRKHTASVDGSQDRVLCSMPCRRGRGRPGRLVLSAAAKVNLALEVLGRRADGYHEIATVMQAVDLCDRLMLEDADVIELRAAAPGVPTDERQPGLRAARRAPRGGRDRARARITLDKRIPVAAGLGGGSADAAAVLVGLNRLWGLRWPVERAGRGGGGRSGWTCRSSCAAAPPWAPGAASSSPRSRGGAGAGAREPALPLSTAEMYGRRDAGDVFDGARAKDAPTALGSRSAGVAWRSALQWARAAAAAGGTADRPDARRRCWRRARWAR